MVPQLPPNLSLLVDRDRRGLPLGREEVAAAISTRVRLWSSIAQPEHRDDIVQKVLWALVRRWETGASSLEQVTAKPYVQRCLRNAAADEVRRRSRQRTVSLDAPAGAGGATLGELWPSLAPGVDEIVAMRSEIARSHAEESRLRDYLSTRPRLRIVERHARAGLPSAEIVDLLAAEGHHLTDAQIRQWITRLRRRFPLLAHRWDK